MKLIIGLGNPTKQYENTRHNAGFIILEEIQKDLSFPEFQVNKKFEAEMSEAIIENERVILAKPQTFMNLSGKSVSAIMTFYKIPVENLTVIHDDLDIDLGTFKISSDSSAAGHNGVASIFEILGTQKIKRIRVGIEGAERKNERQMAGSDFVLQKFSDEELETMKKLSKEVAKNL